MPALNFVWQQDPIPVWTTGFDTWAHVVKAFILDLAKYYAGLIQDWMQTNAAWRDVTGEARTHLYAIVGQTVTNVFIELGNPVPYFRHLEFGFGGRYAIIGPALDHWYPIIFADLQQVLGRR